MKTMLRLTLERFELATEQEKQETYNREFNKVELLKATTEIEGAQTLLVILREFFTPRLILGPTTELKP